MRNCWKCSPVLVQFSEMNKRKCKTAFKSSKQVGKDAPMINRQFNYKYTITIANVLLGFESNLFLIDIIIALIIKNAYLMIAQFHAGVITVAST